MEARLAQAHVACPPCTQVKRLLTRPLGRPATPLRKIALEQPGAGYNIVPPPELQDSKVRQLLTGCSTRLSLRCEGCCGG